MVQLRDRNTAGKMLAKLLQDHEHDPGLLVLALPRGGLPVAFEVAKALKAPLDVYLVRKLGVPGHEELAMGALASSSDIVLNEEVVEHYNISQKVIDRVAAKEKMELERREKIYREGKAPLDIAGKTIVLIDDGLATGSTMLAAVKALRKQGVGKLIVAVPVAPEDTCNWLRPMVDELICLYQPQPFFGVGQWYIDFTQTTDAEVLDFLHRAENRESL